MYRMEEKRNVIYFTLSGRNKEFSTLRRVTFHQEEHLGKNEKDKIHMT